MYDGLALKDLMLMWRLEKRELHLLRLSTSDVAANGLGRDKPC